MNELPPPTCPKCNRTDHQHRSGRSKDRSTVRYRCTHCQKKYTHEPLKPGWHYRVRIDEVLHMLNVEKMKKSDIAKTIGVTRQTIHNWLKRHAEEKHG
jgi:transposase-like protein